MPVDLSEVEERFTVIREAASAAVVAFREAVGVVTVTVVGGRGPAGAPGAPGAAGMDGAAGAPGAAGPPGPVGPTGPVGSVGPIGIEWKGTWNSTTAYVVDDAVEHNGTTYVAMVGSTNVPPPSPGWEILSAKGDTGAQGPAGPAGAAGATGPAGPAGPVGPAGPAGPAGATGAAGPAGAAGAPGAAGATGPAGAPGADADARALTWFSA